MNISPNSCIDLSWEDNSLVDDFQKSFQIAVQVFGSGSYKIFHSLGLFPWINSDELCVYMRISTRQKSLQTLRGLYVRIDALRQLNNERIEQFCAEKQNHKKVMHRELFRKYGIIECTYVERPISIYDLYPTIIKKLAGTRSYHSLVLSDARANMVDARESLPNREIAIIGHFAGRTKQQVDEEKRSIIEQCTFDEAQSGLKLLEEEFTFDLYTYTMKESGTNGSESSILSRVVFPKERQIDATVDNLFAYKRRCRLLNNHFHSLNSKLGALKASSKRSFSTTELQDIQMSFRKEAHLRQKILNG